MSWVIQSGESLQQQFIAVCIRPAVRNESGSAPGSRRAAAQALRVPTAGQQGNLGHRRKKNGLSKNVFRGRKIRTLIEQSGQQHVRQSVMLMLGKIFCGSGGVRGDAFQEMTQGEQEAAEGNLGQLKFVAVGGGLMGARRFRNRRVKLMFVPVTIAIVVPDGQRAGILRNAGVRVLRSVAAVLHPPMQRGTETHGPGQGKAQGKEAGQELVQVFQGICQGLNNPVLRIV